MFTVLLSDYLSGGSAVLLTATPASTSVALTWTAGSGATNYDIKYGIVSGSYSTTLTDVGNVTSYTVTGLTAGTIYYFVVVSKSSGGNAPNSNELSAAVGRPNTPVQTAPTAGDAQVTLFWNAASGATNYDVRWGTTTGLHPNTVTSVGNVTTYVHTGRLNGTTLYYVIVAKNAYGISDESNEYSVTPTGTVVTPSAPTLRAVTSGATQLLVEWDVVSTAASYTVKYGTSPSSHPTTVSGITASSYTITGLSNGTTYYVVVTATNGAGTSGDSNEKSGTPRAGSYIQTRYNNLQLGDIAFMQKLFSVEYFKTETHASADAGKIYKAVTVNGADAYEYQITRDLDGTGANDWDTGDSMVNTGVAGLGHIEAYAFSSVYAKHLSYLVQYHSSAYTSIDAESTTFDINLSAANDAFYIGMSNTRFTESFFNLIQAVSATGLTFIQEYWNGTTWATLTTVWTVNGSTTYSDGVTPVTHPFLNTGTVGFSWTAPSNWAKTTINSVNNGYYIRIRTSAVTTWTVNARNARQPVVRNRALYGSTIVGWRRNSSAPTDVKEAWALGNLKSLYTYGTDTMGFAAGSLEGAWVAVDATNGLRMMAGTAMRAQIFTNGDFIFKGDDDNYLQWDGTQLLLKGVVNITGSTGGDADVATRGYVNQQDATVLNSTTTAITNSTTPAYILGQITTVKTPIGTPVGQGLYMASNFMGFYNSAYAGDLGWRTYIGSDGQFVFRGTSGALIGWNGYSLYGSNGSTVQWYSDSVTGEMSAGAGIVKLNSGGVSIASSNHGNYDSRTALKLGSYGVIFQDEYLSDPTSGSYSTLWIVTKGAGSSTIGDSYLATVTIAAGESSYSQGFSMQDTGRTDTSGTYLLGNVLIGNGNVPSRYSLSVGDIGSNDYAPTSTDWWLKTTLVLNGQNATAIGFHDSGNRVDFIRAVGGEITIGYDGGFGSAIIQIPQSLGIGVSNSDTAYSRLRVNGGIASKGGTYSGLSFDQRDNSSQTWVLYANSNYASIFMDADLVRFDTSGVASKLSAGTAWVSFSDAQVKNVQGDYKGGLNEILKVRPIVYDYNGIAGTIPNGKQNVGVLAQDIQKVLPNTVSESAEGYLMLDPTELTYALINAVKELSAQVKELQNRVSANG